MITNVDQVIAIFVVPLLARGGRVKINRMHIIEFSHFVLSKLVSVDELGKSIAFNFDI